MARNRVISEVQWFFTAIKGVILAMPPNYLSGPNAFRLSGYQPRNTESSWRAVYHDLIAEQANLGVALDIDGFVFAQFGFGGDEQGASRAVALGAAVRAAGLVHFRNHAGFQQSARRGKSDFVRAFILETFIQPNPVFAVSSYH